MLSLVVVAAYAWQVWLYRGYVNDDAYITFRYASMLAAGKGPYFNVGEHVEGYSNFLLMLILSAIAHVDPWVLPAASKWIGIFSGLVAVIAAYALASTLAKDATDQHTRFAGLVAAGIVAANPGFAVNTVSGLETSLYSALLALGVLLGDRADRASAWRGSGLAFSAALLTRPEAALIFSASWIVRFLSSTGARRHLWIDASIFTATFAGQILLRHFLYDGEWLPNTYYAKSGGFERTTAFAYVASGLFAPFGGMLPALAGWGASLLSTPTRSRILAVALPGLAGGLSPLFEGPDWMPGYRFIVPYLPMLAAVFAIGCTVVVRTKRMPAWSRLPIAMLVIAVLWVAQGGARSQLVSYVESRAEGYRSGHRALAEWLKAHCEPGDAVALMDIGIVGYRLPDQTIIDTSGLTDRKIARSPGRLLDKSYEISYLLERKPRFVVLVFAQAPGTTATDSGIQLVPYNRVEDRIYRDAEFRRSYLSENPEGGSDSPAWRAAVTKGLGAEKIFVHGATPGNYYLLAVFRSASS